jgi:uncharacterized membrane protein
MLPSLFTPIPFVYAVREIYHREDEKVSMVLLVSVWKIPVKTQADYLIGNRHRKFCEYKNLTNIKNKFKIYISN